MDYRISFSGDTQSLADLRRMQKAGVINRDRFLEIAALPTACATPHCGRWRGIDPWRSGGCLESPAERIVFMHMDRLSDTFDAHFTSASAGKRFVLLPGRRLLPDADH